MQSSPLEACSYSLGADAQDLASVLHGEQAIGLLAGRRWVDRWDDRPIARLVVGFTWMRHDGSLNQRKPRVQANFGEPQYVVCLIGKPMLLIEAKPSEETLGHFSKASTQLRIEHKQRLPQLRSSCARPLNM